jgi:hypothetical protein
VADLVQRRLGVAVGVVADEAVAQADVEPVDQARDGGAQALCADAAPRQARIGVLAAAAMADATLAEDDPATPPLLEGR